MENNSSEVQPTLQLGAKRLPADTSRFPDPVYLDDQGTLICPHTVGSAFGGPFDSGDDGGTSSGLRTDGPGGLVGCSLPMPFAHGCTGTPIAALPWRTLVHVTCGHRTVMIPLVDVGPSGGLKPCRMIDLTTEAWSLLLQRDVHPKEVNTLTAHVSFRIPGAGPFMRDYSPKPIRH